MTLGIFYFCLQHSEEKWHSIKGKKEHAYMLSVLANFILPKVRIHMLGFVFMYGKGETIKDEGTSSCHSLPLQFYSASSK